MTEETENANLDNIETDDDYNQLTDWVNEPSIADLKQNIDDAKNDQDKHSANVARWLSNMANDSRVKVKGRSNIAPKLIRKQAEWRYSSLTDPFLSTSDLYNVRPTTAGDRKRAKQNELVLNKQFNTQLGKVQFIDDYVRDVVDIGTVIVKLGWDTNEEEVKTQVPTYQYKLDDSGQLAQQYMGLLKLKMENPEGYADHSTPGLDQALKVFLETGNALFVKETGTREKVEMVETKNQPTLEIPHPDNIIIDPSCGGDMSKARFIGEKFKDSLSGLKKDGKYTNLDKVNVEGGSALASPDYEDSEDIASFTFKDKPRKQMVIFTYWGEWDIRGDGTTVQIVGSWIGDTKIRMEISPFPDNEPPFVKAVYMPVRDSVFGEPDGELLHDNQEIIGAVTRGAIDLLGKSANAQTGTRKDFLDVTNQRLFRAGKDYEFNGNVDPRLGVYQHTFPEIPQSAFNMINMQNMDAESLTGVKAFASGISGKGLGDTATGVRGALDAASKRELGILRRLAQGIVDIGRKIIAMNAEFLSDEEVIRITDEEFVQVRRDDLAGKFDLQLSISTAEEDNKKAEELAFMFQTAGPHMDPDFSKMILSDIARLRKMPDLAEKIESYQPQPDPIAEKLKQMEIELKQAQINKENALANKHNAEAAASGGRDVKDRSQADLNQAKAGEAGAKARSTHSEADQKDLDYLDNQSGAPHAREIDKINTKSQNDMVADTIKDSMKETQPGNQA